ncbi:EF-hand domain-containing protein [Pannonibacter phragmitetus]|uniref:EF-hand domain-containing protein n=1 Tax=Pannonibacter phragmitetus TaxID=121719 RepID=UPI003D2ED598
MTALKTIAIGTIAAALATSVAGIALADSFGPKGWGGKGHHGGRDGGRMVEMFDQNKDGSITQDEVNAAVAERFSAADADKDGRVTLDEFKTYRITEMQPMKVRAFQRLDRDGDGKVTRAEFDRISDRMFARLDRGGNGELKPMPRGPEGRGPDARGPEGKGPEGRGPEGRGGAGGRPDGKGPEGMRMGREDGPYRQGREGGPHGRHGMRMMEMFERFDVNGDGTVTRAEFDEARGQLFALADTGNTGSFDLQGFDALFASMAEPRLVRMFQRLDTDGDLTITAEENAAWTTDLVARMDRNSDGVLTKADFRKGGKGPHGEWRGDRHGGGKGMGPQNRQG